MEKKQIFSILLLLTCPFLPGLTAKKRPKLMVIFVIDGFAQHEITKHRKNLHGGIGRLLEKGVVYEHAHHPHAMPATATGHTALSTGTLAKNHGIIGNRWFDADGTKKIYCDDDTPDSAAVFSPDGWYDYGRSAKNTFVDGLSDQVLMHNNEKNVALALSAKSRAAIAMASKLGKAIWFDEKTGTYTSSKAYFDELPPWLTSFNETYKVPKPQETLSWALAFQTSSTAYANKYLLDTRFTKFDLKIENQTLTIQAKPNGKKPYDPQEPYGFFAKTPTASTQLLALAQNALQFYLNNQNPDRMILWISLSNLDKINHLFGPQSIATIDTMYHMDRQVGDFMNFAETLVDKEKILYVLTSDHGSMPIPELLATQGFDAQRINVKKLKKEMNLLVDKQFGVKELITNFKTPQFFFNEIMFSKLPKPKQRAIVKTVKKFLLAQKGIKNVWTRDELQRAVFSQGSFEERFKQQLYPGRSGLLTIQTHPYVYLTRKKTGTGHRTPYHYDTNVPLIIYQDEAYEKKRITQKVWTPQVAPTLAQILNINKPSAATFHFLPGLFKA